MSTSVPLHVEWIESSLLDPSEGKDSPQAHCDVPSASKMEEKITEKDKEDAWKKLLEADGILVPGGFGDRGIEGKISAIKYARENRKIYYFD